MRKLSYICTQKTVIVAQLVRASDCGSEGRGFETHHSPKESTLFESVLFILYLFEGEIISFFLIFFQKLFPIVISYFSRRQLKMVLFVGE